MESVKVVEGQRKTRLQSKELQNLHKQSFVIIPYQVSGFIDFTNKGATNYQVNPDDFETFKRVWTGNDACVIAWKNSIVLSQNSDTKEMEVHYQLGEYFLGLLELNSSENNFDKDKSFSQYTSQEIQNELTFRVDATFEITEYYNLMFYKIPEISKSQLFRITSIERDFVGTELVGYVITFKTINQELANTGRAKQQNIMPNAPGQGYLEASVEDKQWFDEYGKDLTPGIHYVGVPGNRYLVADFQKTLNRPVRKMVVKLFGNAFLDTVVCLGRPVVQGDSLEKFRPQRVLFNYNLTSATTPNLMNTQNNCASFYFGEFWPTLEFFKDLMTSIKDSLTPVNQWKYQGWLTYSYNDLIKTNPVEDGNYKYELFGYMDTTVRPPILRNWICETPEKILDMSGCYGCEQQYKVGGNKDIADHMFDNYWTTKEVKTLPISVKDTLSFGWTLATSSALASKGGKLGWGGASMLFAIGISGTLIEKLKPRKCNGFRGIASASFIDFNNELFKQTDADGNKVPFNMLEQSENTPSSIFFDSATLNTAYQGTLTDKIQSLRAGDKILSTLNVGQTKDEDGNYILPTQEEFLLNGDAKLLPTYDEYSGYIVDSFKICAIGSCDISVEFLDINNEVVWTGVYQSEAKWTGSMREIWTEKSCSVFGRENVFYTEPIPYPQPIPEPPASFPVAVQKEVKAELWKSVKGHMPGGGSGSNECKNWNHAKYSDSYGSNWFKEECEIELLNDVSKDELLSIWQNVDLKFYGKWHKGGTIDGWSIFKENSFNIPKRTSATFWELFSTKPDEDGVYVFKIIDETVCNVNFGVKSQLVAPPPSPFPIGTWDFAVCEETRFDAIYLKYYTKESKLKLYVKHHILNQNEMPCGRRFMIGTIQGGGGSASGIDVFTYGKVEAQAPYWIFFESVNVYATSGLDKIIIVPKR